MRTKEEVAKFGEMDPELAEVGIGPYPSITNDSLTPCSG